MPKTCKEFADENSVATVKHKVEEAMTEALLRDCPKCKNRFFKEEGKISPY